MASGDSEKLGEFIKDPEQAISGAELAEEDRAALRSGNPSEIYGRLTGQETFRPAPATVLVVDLMPSEAGGDPDTPTIRGYDPGAYHQAQQQYLTLFPQQPPPQIQFPPPQIQFPPPPPTQIHFSQQSPQR